MREILFRGKRLDNGEWVYGYYFVTPITAEFDVKPENGAFFASGDEPIRHCVVEDMVAFEVDPSTVGQYTGLRDKNGTRIFEGDLMSLVTESGDIIIREVQFDDGAFCLTGEQEDDLRGLDWAVEMCDGIVGDNIHDNPELLK